MNETQFAVVFASLIIILSIAGVTLYMPSLMRGEGGERSGLASETKSNISMILDTNYHKSQYLPVLPTVNFDPTNEEHCVAFALLYYHGIQHPTLRFNFNNDLEDNAYQGAINSLLRHSLARGNIMLRCDQLATQHARGLDSRLHPRRLDPKTGMDLGPVRQMKDKPRIRYIVPSRLGPTSLPVNLGEVRVKQ